MSNGERGVAVAVEALRKMPDAQTESDDMTIRNTISKSKKTTVLLRQSVIPNAPIVYGIVQPGEHDPDGIAFVQSRDLGNKIVAISLQRTSKEIASRYTRSTIEPDDILFSLRGNIGMSSIAEQDLKGANISRGVARIRVTDSFDPFFVRYALQSDEVCKRIFQAKNGSTFNEITIDALRKIEIPRFSKSEQVEIAAVLRTWDEAIEILLRLSELRQKQYLGLRDHLIDWSKHQRAAKEFLNPVSRPVSKPTSGYRALSIRSHGKGTFDRYVENPESIEMDTLYVVKSGDIIVNITFAWEGAVALVPRDHDGCLVSHRFPTFVPKMERVDARYLRHALRMARFTYLLGIVSPGGAGRNRVLSKSDFLDLMVPLPPLDQQRRIAMILNDAEDAISAEEKYLSALKRQKRGLMQKLLTGEWRVKC